MPQRAQYSGPITTFIEEAPDSILGKITSTSAHDVELLQRNAWLEQIRVLKDQLTTFQSAYIFLEFSIPRMGKRADVVLIFEGVVFVIEFKVGATKFLAADQAQATDYALDLLNFHEGSHQALLVPILVATEAHSVTDSPKLNESNLMQCLKSSATDLKRRIAEVTHQGRSMQLTAIDPENWVNSIYKPTPTIVEAAQALYRDHDVTEISRSDASATNLSETADEISRIIKNAKATSNKAICFVTGVPGAGKTLAGLSVTTSQMNHVEDEHAVFLSGNGPLVKVLQEALAKDLNSRQSISMLEARRQTKTFIQNIHHFRDESLESELPPADRVVVFDEAQRAWDQHHTVKFMRQKKGKVNFNSSEPEFLIEVLDRHEDWCVIIALIGGGQEINSGEAGLSEWFKALEKRFRHWDIYHSKLISSSEYAGNINYSELTNVLKTHPREALHLSVSLRSFRAGRLSEFVHHLINNNSSRAFDCLAAIQKTFPIVLTRDLAKAKAWLKQRTRGNELCGVTASSGGRRLKPEGIDVKAAIEPENWFLNGPEDVRSCQYLEDVATEFSIQGLELDWVAVAWDADLRRDSDNWVYRRFSGTKWQNINKKDKQQYLLNAYRVLLTRARQGMVIFVPQGDRSDPTRLPEFYDPIANYLQKTGIPLID
ncbi:DUF2075 domain-containing protein [Akkermansiaceae bacterium]|nr:DUF2075 domain-containing protein [Akkermansiaceae bacterium]